MDSYFWGKGPYTRTIDSEALDAVEVAARWSNENDIGARDVVVKA